MNKTVFSTKLSEQRKGEVFATLPLVFEAWFPIFAFFTVTALGAIHAYFYSLLIASVALFIWLSYRKRTSELFHSQARKPLLLVSFWMTLLYILIFVALEFTSASHVALILFLQILFSYLFLGRKQGERMEGLPLLGVVSMTVGALIILFPEDLKINIGDLLALIAAAIAPIANLYQKQARQFVSSDTILTARSVIALPFLWGLMVLLEPSQGWQTIQSVLHWLFLTGILVFVLSKIFWIEALHRLPITKVNALYAFSPLLTMVLAFYMLNETPTLHQLFGALPILLGGYWITRQRL